MKTIILRSKQFTIITICCIALAGCASKEVTPQCTCPSFPVPSNTVIDKLVSLHDTEVDNWVIRLYQHKKMIDIQNEKK